MEHTSAIAYPFFSLRGRVEPQPIDSWDVSPNLERVAAIVRVGTAKHLMVWSLGSTEQYAQQTVLPDDVLDVTIGDEHIVLVHKWDTREQRLTVLDSGFEPVSVFDIGFGAEKVSVATTQIWVSYFDEGVFGFGK